MSVEENTRPRSLFDLDGYKYNLDVYNTAKNVDWNGNRILANRATIRSAERRIEFCEHYFNEDGTPRTDDFTFDIDSALNAVNFFSDMLEIPVQMPGSLETTIPFDQMPFQLSSTEWMYGLKAGEGEYVTKVLGLYAGENVIGEQASIGPKHWGKSLTAGANTLYRMMKYNGENFLVHCLATDKDQAQITTKMVQLLIKQIERVDLGLPTTDRFFNFIKYRKGNYGPGPGVVLHEDGSTFYYNTRGKLAGGIIAVDGSVKGKAGETLNGAVFDEIWQYQNSQAMRDTRRSVTSKGVREWFIFLTTNWGDASNVIFQSELRRFMQILEAPLGSRYYNPTVEMQIFGLDDGMDYKDPKLHIIANPCDGKTIFPKHWIDAENDIEMYPDNANKTKMEVYGIVPKDDGMRFKVHAWDACEVEEPITGADNRIIVSVDFAYLQNMLAVCVLNSECAELFYWWNDEARKKRGPSFQDTEIKRWLESGKSNLVMNTENNDMEAFALWFNLRMKKFWVGKDVHVIVRDVHDGEAFHTFRRAGYPIPRGMKSNGVYGQADGRVTYHQCPRTPNRDNPLSMHMAIKTIREWVNGNILKIVKNPVLRYNRTCSVSETDKYGYESLVIDPSEGSEVLVDGMIALMNAVCLANYYLMGDDEGHGMETWTQEQWDEYRALKRG